MASRKLNVLVYTGTGTTLASVRQAIYTLRRLLSPNYAVIPITESVLLKEPWAPTCALLVFPGGADLGYCRVLNGAGNRLISAYVRYAGGKYLGFCAGGYYASARCEFEVGSEDKGMEVVGKRELGFYQGTCRGGAFKGFGYGSEKGARAARVKVREEVFDEHEVPREFNCYYNGGGVFVDAEKVGAVGVEILAEYGDEIDVGSGERRAAVVYCKVGEGAALLTGPHPEFAAANLTPQEDLPGYDELIDSLAADDESRTQFLKACLTKLGLEVSQDSSSVPSLSSLHLSSINTTEVGELLHSLSNIITKDQDEEFVKGENDTFHLEKPDSRWSMAGLNDALTALTDPNKITKRIISHEESWPEVKLTPYFNHSVFYSSLADFRSQDTDASEWGNILMYGEVVTSTNTLLDKNPSLISHLPTGFTLAATTQTTGRGRGSNVWVSPFGSLIMSTVINHPGHLSSSRPIIFIQYLAAVAIVQAVHSYGPGYEAIPVKLKWPNDIYALDPSAEDGEAKYVKIGGILSNCAYSNGGYQVVLGIGINTTNARPTTSLDALVDKINGVGDGRRKKLERFRVERLMAGILARLEVLYGRFCRKGFEKGLEEEYYASWLHTGQVVTLEAEGGVRARVKGITRDWGMLMAEEVREDGDGRVRGTGRVWALQSDENSFDFWKGLVRRKV